MEAYVYFGGIVKKGSGRQRDDDEEDFSSLKLMKRSRLSFFVLGPRESSYTGRRFIMGKT